MSDQQIDWPTFNRRSKEADCQVRFFADKELYKKFVKKVHSNDLQIKDVFADMIQWFVDSDIKIVEAAMEKR